ncbi:MAG: hypothetical protein ACM3JG_06480 [Thiohalocapsa sp.]
MLARLLPRLLGALAIGVAGLVVAADRLPSAPPGSGVLAELIHGQRPAYGPQRLGPVPNEPAIVRRLWVPDLDGFFDPQGLAVADGAVLVSGYRSNDYRVHRGPCVVFRLDPQSGRAAARLDVPAPCGHAGGLAVDGGGMLYVADTRVLFATVLRKAFTDRALPFRLLPLGGGVSGGLAMATPAAVWLGSYREDGPGRLLRFDVERLARLTPGAILTSADAAAQLPIPSYAQGAALDRDGALWVARGDTRWGELVRLDPATGSVLQRYAAPPAIEGIAFDADGLLWTVSEAGVRHDYENFFVRLMTPFYPLVIALDPAKLQ